PLIENKIKVLGFLLVLFFSYCGSIEVTSNVKETNLPIWKVEGDCHLSYRIFTLTYNDTNQITFKDDQHREIGTIYQDNLLLFEILELPNLNDQENEVQLRMKGVTISEGWNISYSVPIKAEWPNETNGPFMLSSIVPIWSTEEDWNAYAQKFVASGFRVTNNDSHFTLFGSNPSIRVMSFKVVWKKGNGVMDYYYCHFIDRDEITTTIELVRESTFWYTWGIETPYKMVYFVDSIINGTNNFLSFTDDDVIKQGEIFEVSINELNDLKVQDSCYTATMTNTRQTIEQFEIPLLEPGFISSNIDVMRGAGWWAMEAASWVLQAITMVGDAITEATSDSWDTYEDWWGDADQTTSNEDDIFTLQLDLESGEFLEMQWNKTTGVLMQYSKKSQIADWREELRFHLVTAGIINLSSNTSSVIPSGPPTPGFEWQFLILILLCFVVVGYRRK
ncbi:MAG: hypothetical protein ACFFCQ_02170, partial [Promethearchaeota archaeon]